MKLSVVIPTYNEEGSVEKTVTSLYAILLSKQIDHEIVVVDDSSTDRTVDIVQALKTSVPSLVLKRSHYPNGFGFAVRCGLETYLGNAVAIVMADGSDDPVDLVAYYEKLGEGYDCVFGSRFIKGSKVVDYPVIKLFVNRLVNWFIKVLFRVHYNDTTNAFKCYRREVIDQVQPLLSNHFNLTVELPLKAIIRGFSYAVVPITWINREHGESKLKLKEMGSRYLFIVLYAYLEKLLSRGDYKKKGQFDK